MFFSKIRNRLAKKTAAFMSAVLLFTSGADMFAPITEVVAADEADEHGTVLSALRGCG